MKAGGNQAGAAPRSRGHQDDYSKNVLHTSFLCCLQGVVTYGTAFPPPIGFN